MIRTYSEPFLDAVIRAEKIAILEGLREEIKTWKRKFESEQEEHKFYANSAMDSKRKNKLLKDA